MGGQLQAVPGKFTKLHLVETRYKALKLRAPPKWAWAAAAPGKLGKFDKLHSVKQVIQGSGLKLRALPSRVCAVAAGSAWQVYQITFSQTYKAQASNSRPHLSGHWPAIARPRHWTNGGGTRLHCAKKLITRTE